jgi:hypothetical protein
MGQMLSKTFDPENRLVAAELERRWNEALKVVAQLQTELDALREQATRSLSAAARDKMLRLGDELPRFWQHPKSSIGIKKRILRTVLREIVVAKHDDTIRALLHWQGSDHSKHLAEAVIDDNKNRHQRGAHHF